MIKLLPLLLLLLSGCTLEVRDKTLTREEVATAFQERDQYIKAIALELQAVKTKLPVEPKKEEKKK